MQRKIKVVWVCHFSNNRIRKHIVFDRRYFKYVIKRLLGRRCETVSDFAVWVTNGIKEFESFKDVELTVIFPHRGVKGTLQRFEDNGVTYFCFRSEDDHLTPFILEKVFKFRNKRYNKNKKIVQNIIKTVHPDIVHYIGAENPYYSCTLLGLNEDLQTIVSLQTLMSDPSFRDNYPISLGEYNYRVEIEKKVILRSKYIASKIQTFRDIITKDIKPNAVFLPMSLAVGQQLYLEEVNKEYDFVYYAANVEKAADYAIEAFAIAQKLMPGLTLNISGYCSEDYKAKLDYLIYKNNIVQSVFFTGRKDCHEDVLNQIKKSRFAVLPLKIDLISGTIREAMACGLPVVTTITPATPSLNEKRESVLLSPKGDYLSMAQNMIRLVGDDAFATNIRENALLTIQESYDNKKEMRNWVNVYNSILDN